jgi:NAD(P)-dependent dehydrogenase (short-subunit alcohol dehydrogenase family)
MKNKLCVVTGANAGIGKEVAKSLVQQGAKVIMVCRSEERAREARNEILGAVTRSSRPAVDVEVADFSDLDSVARLAQRLAANYRSINALINNAGAFFSDRHLVSQGWEKTFVTNHLGPMLLTERILLSMGNSVEGNDHPPMRIVNVASEAHHQVRRRTEDWHGEETYSGIKAYGLTKLCNILYTKDLANRFPANQVVAYSLHPGVIATNIGTKGGGIAGLIWKISKPFMSTVEKGAQTPIYLATQDKIQGQSGDYFIRCKVTTPSKLARDASYLESLMQYSQNLLKPWL